MTTLAEPLHTVTPASLSLEERRAAAAIITNRLRKDPVWFVEHILGHDPWEMPRRIMRALRTPRARVAVKSCHASGKTFTAAETVLWWVMRGGIAVTTAPTWMQVKQLLWAEIHKAHERSRYPLGGKLTQTGFEISTDNYAIGLSTNEPVRFQGFHGTILIVMDEAPGVKPGIWEAIEGIRAGGDVRILALGNPIIASGPFYDAFSSNRSGWQTFTISAFSTPNLEGLTLETLLALADDELDVARRPYLVQRRWVVEKYHEWGVTHPLFESKVMGQFPAQAEDALLSLTWLERAALREAEDDGKSPVIGGLDVAGPGEAETVLWLRSGAHILGRYAWPHADPRGEVMAALAPWKHRLEALNVDAAGIGWGMVVHLAELGVPVVPVNVGSATGDPDMYSNLKAELYWGLRERFRAGHVNALRVVRDKSGEVIAEDSWLDETTIGQLAGIRYRHNSRGQVVIESKDEALKRGVKSPDRAEGLMLAFAPIQTLPDEGIVIHDDRVRIGADI